MSQRNKFAALLGLLAVIAAIYYFATANRSTDLSLIGTVDSNQVIVSAKIPGRIERLLVDEGTEVKQGDVIAELDRAELEAQARAAGAQLSSLGSRVSASQATEAQARGETSSDVASAKALLTEAQADLEREQLDNARMVKLAEEGVASQQDRDRSNAALKAVQARVKSLQDQLRAAEARTHQAHAAASNVSATRAEMNAAQAQLAEAQTRLGYTQVVAPVSGTVSVRAARQGEVVTAGQPIVTIVDLNDVWVRAAVPETESDSVALGDALQVRLPSGRVLDGKVIFKGVEADFATQRDVGRSKRDIKTVVLKVRVDNRDQRLTPGMTAEVLVPARKK
ncbi:MAG: HlyD family secretion protein [Terriglobales bacterium]